MRHILAGWFLVALLTVPTSGQSGAGPSTFEVADVRPSAPVMNPNPQMRPGAIRSGIYEIRSATLVDLIRTAYSIEADKVLGGPSWLELDRFDVTARVPAGTTADGARPMLRALLADRFKLAVKQDSREMHTWVLSQAPGGAKLLRAQSAGIAPSCQGQPDGPHIKAACRSMTLTGFIELLPRVAGSYVTSTITDSTGLTGPWDFDIKFTNNRAQLADQGAEGIPLFDALDKQLGLKLEEKTITATGFLVEAVSRTPTANAPGIETILPPPPAPEFEVADLKPTAPGNTQQRAQILPTGAINASAMPVRDLINLAWGFNGNDFVVGPKWIETTRFDIIGKAFSGADAQFVDDEVLRLSLRKLLVDRFQIKFHFEERPLNAYALVAGNVKMTKADPSSRTRCYVGVPPGAKDPRQAIPTRVGLLTCENATMAYFAERLRGTAGGYIQAPIAEMTGLEGGWNFTLNWSAIQMFPGGVNGIGGRAGGAGEVGAAPAVPTGAITLPEAVEGQLGLKLEMGKRPVRVLVIDQISETPTGN
jgi:uncharacterized protein (TIGR03435 family)